MDRPNDVRVPTFETTHRRRPPGAKVDHFVAGRVGVREHTGEASVAGSELVELVARRRGRTCPETERRGWRRPSAPPPGTSGPPRAAGGARSGNTAERA